MVVIPGDFPAMVSRSAYLKRLDELADVRLYTDRPRDDVDLLQRLKPAEILLNSRSAVQVRESLLDQLPELKMIAVCGIGYDAIDLSAAAKRGIVVCNIPGRTASVVAEHAFGLMLSVSRRMAAMTMQIRNGTWPPDIGVSLLGKQIGVIGTGNIGCEMIRMCKAFGMEVVASSFHEDPDKAKRLGFRYVPFDELLQTSDVVSLHVRLSEESRGMIGKSQLLQMKLGAILINTARAAVVDTQALVAELKSGHLFGAGIDVYDEEPPAGDSALLSCDNVVLTPHSADQTPEGLDLLTLGCVDNIRAFLDGNPQNVVGLG